MSDRREDRGRQQAPAGPPDPLFVEVQKRLIAALLFNADEINRILELVVPDDFFEPQYEFIYSAAAEIARRNEDVSVVSIAAELEHQGSLAKTGGSAGLYALREEGRRYLLEAPVGLYATIMKETAAKAKVKRLLDEHKETFISDSGVQASDGIAELQSSLNDQLYRLSDESTSTKVSEGHDEYLALLEERRAITEANAGASEGLVGIPSLLPSINYYTGGWRPGQLITIGARTGVGKALALDTPIPTPSGWTTMGELKIGDEVFGRDGKPTKVVNATEVQYGRKCYEVVTHNGARIVADADHRWLTDTYHSRRYGTGEEVRTTEELKNTLTVLNDQRKNHSIRVSEPLVYPDSVELPIDPYLLGYWLGDGHSWSNNISVHHLDYPSLKQQIEAAGYFHTVNNTHEDCWSVTFSRSPISRGGDMKNKSGTKNDLRVLNLLENKHIPEAYLHASIEDRRRLLAGLLDSDGHAGRNGRAEFGVVMEKLADDYAELARSLGHVVFRRDKVVKGAHPHTSVAYTVDFKAEVNPFVLARKAANFVARQVRNTRIYISEINEVESVPVRCIQVDNKEHVYLAGEDMVPTHNTVFAVNSAVAAAQAGKSVLFFSLEMGGDELKDRIVSSTTGVPLYRLSRGTLRDQDRQMLADTDAEIKAMKIKIETDAKVTLDAIRAKALRQAQTPEGLDFIVLDYLQLVTPSGRFGSRQEAVADMSRNVKLLAKQLGIPIMVLVQVKREGKEDENPLPKLDQIRESGAIAQDSDIVILLHRDEALDDTIPHTLVLLEKNRNGEASKTIRCHSNLECSVFREVIRSKDSESAAERQSDEDEAAAADDFDLGDFLDDEPGFAESDLF